MKNEIQRIEPKVAKVFNTYPRKVKSRILLLRKVILDTASSIPFIRRVEETLKWGEPSYIVHPLKLGSTVRIAWKESQKDKYAVYFKCTANLVPAFREKYDSTFTFGGTRSIIFGIDDEIQIEKLKHCIAMALTYHRNKKLKPNLRWDMVIKLIT